MDFHQDTPISNGKSRRAASEKELSKKGKLKDPEYVKRYARGKFLVIKKGEQVFKLPGGSSEDTNCE